MTFIKGKSGNPSGRPALPWEVLQQKKNLRAKFDATLCELLMLSLVEVKKVASDKKGGALQRVLASAIVSLHKSPDTAKLDKLLERTLGKAIEIPEMEMREAAELVRQLMKMPEDEKIKLIETRLSELKIGREEGNGSD